jgi:enoyl-CoA hydratase/carnithine racemase
MSGDAGLRVERTDAVLRLTLDRPARRNAFDEGLLRALAAALEPLPPDRTGPRVVGRRA